MPSIRILPKILVLSQRCQGGMPGAVPGADDAGNNKPIGVPFPTWKMGWVPTFNDDGTAILDDEGNPLTVWGRINVQKNIGDELAYGTQEEWDDGKVEITEKVAQALIKQGFAEEVA